MDSNNIHEEITRLLYKIEEQYSHILQHHERIPLLDIDIVLKDMGALYESFLDLRSIANEQRRNILKDVVIETKTFVAETAKEPVTVHTEPVERPEQTVTNEAPSLVEETKTEIAEKEVTKTEDTAKALTETPTIAWQKTFDTSKDGPENINRPAPAPVNKPIEQGHTPLSAPKVDLLKEREKDFVPTVRKVGPRPEPVEPEAKKESIFDKAASLYDKFAKPNEKTVASQAVKQPISNIKSAIGINEKFTYLKELFGNNINEYNEALDKLNNFDSYTEAEDFFQELKEKNNWDTESKSFHGLADLLNRRYLHNI